MVIVGGGVCRTGGDGGVRRDLAGGLAEVELLAPRREFEYRPVAVGEPFGAGR